MNLPPRWKSYLEIAGMEALHWSEVGDPRASDQEIMNWAVDNGWVVFSHDLDFCALLAATRSRSPTVIQIRSDDITPEALGDLFVRSVKRFRNEMDTGALLVIEPGRSRIRLLPLGTD